MLLRQHGIRPSRRLGQHFLVDGTVLRRILDAAELQQSDTVLEIGPGVGVLTHALAGAAGRVVAVEVDPRMGEVLEDTVGHLPNVQIVAADFLAASPDHLLGFDGAPAGRRLGYKVVANLPYQITSAALRHVLEARLVPELAVVMVQKEVGLRILATPGHMSILAVSVQYYARPRQVVEAPSRAFHPRPKVDSVVLRLDVYDQPPVDAPDTAFFFRVVRAGFGQKRKQLRNSLSSGMGVTPGEGQAALEAAGVDPQRRAETLTLAEWAAVARAMAARLGT